MHNINDLVQDASNQGVELYLKNNKLAYKSHDGPLPDQLKSIIIANKDSIIDFLKHEIASNHVVLSNIGPQIDRVDANHPQPLSYTQQRLWFLDELENGTPQYNMPGAFKINQSIDPNIAEQAIVGIIERHHVLRTVYRKHDNSVAQFLLHDFHFELAQSDFSALSISDQEKAIKGLIHQESNHVFDLSLDLMVRGSHVFLSNASGEKYSAFIFNMHHIASDGWSEEVFIHEFLHRYEQIKRGQSVDLQALPIQYMDYAVWQRQSFEDGTYDKQLSYWQQQLTDIPTVHQLPLDNPRPKVDSHVGEYAGLILEADLSERLLKLAQSQGLTLFMLLHAAVNLLFCRYSNQKEVVMGTPVANRPIKELENVIGFFANTMVLRAHTDFETMAEYLAHVRQVNLDALSNQDIPLEYLLQSAKIERNLQFNPLFQIMFAMNTDGKAVGSQPDFPFEILPSGQDFAKFDLDILAYQQGDTICLKWIYKTSIFQRSSIKQMLKHLRHLLTAMVEKPHARLVDIQLLSDTERQHLILEVNNNTDQSNTTQLMYEPFVEQALKNPDRIAIRHANQIMTYSELNQSSNVMAALLKSHGVTEHAVVALCLDRSITMLVGLLAILKSGACYVAIDPKYPDGRKNFLINDSSASHLLSEETHIDCFSSINSLKIIDVYTLVNTGESANDKSAPHDFNININSNHLAYLIYTSGSTGQPKGVMIKHRNAMAMIQWAMKHYKKDALQGVLASTSVCFDIAVFELFVPLSMGGSIVLVDSIMELHADMHQITLVNTVPSAIKALLAESHIPSSVKVINLAGELLEQRLADQLYDSGIELVYDLYGPSEDTTYSTCELRTKGGQNSIGRPISNTSAYVVDRQLNIMPKGCVGELCLAGEGVAHGYLNRPSLTEANFITNPFDATRPCMYRTGDLVSYLPDNRLVFHGRQDDQVKINGFRIELGEIEHQIQQSQTVQSVKVIIDTSESQKKRVIAYVVPDGQYQGDDESFKEQLMTQLKQHLPNYLMPNHIMVLAEMPLNHNGKIDKNKLPNFAKNLDIILPPVNDIQLQLHTIWSDLLGLNVDELGINHNFFELGGDSIMSIQVVSRAAQQGLYFTVKDIFDAQTIEQLSTLAQTNTDHEIDQSPSEDYLELLPIQQHFFKQSAVINHYNQSVLLSVPDDFTLDTLRLIFTALFARHDVFRLTFENTEKGWQADYRPIHDDLGSHCLEQQNWTELSVEQANQQKDALQASLDITTGQTFKAILIYNDGQQQLLLVAHHLIIDGVSWRILFQDMEFLYQFYRSENRSLPFNDRRKTTSYQHWSEFLRDYANDLAQKQLKYWQASLQKPVARLRPFKALSQWTLNQKNIQLDKHITQKLLTQCNQLYRTQIHELLLSALVLTMREHGSGDVFRIDLETHGREHLSNQIDLSQTMGWFTALYPLTLDLNGQEDLRDIICVTKEHIRQVPNNGIGYGVLKYLSENSEFINQPDSELVFNYLGQFDQHNTDKSAFAIAQESTGQQISSHRRPAHDLSLNGMIHDEQLSFTMTYIPEIYADSLMDAFMKRFQMSIQDVIEHCTGAHQPRLTPSDFPLANVTQDQLNQWSKTHDIQDIYPTTGTQKGLLFHSLMQQGSYISQIAMDFSDLDVVVFKKSWQMMVDRYDIFRTGFVGLDAENIHQLVNKQAELPWRYDDLSHLSKYEQTQQFINIKAADKQQGFDLTQAPLMRITLVKIKDKAYQMLWSHHHALLDGWSMGIVYKGMIECYQSLLENRVPSFRKYQDYKHYLSWLHSRDGYQTEQYWSDYFSAVETSTALPLMHDYVIDDDMDIVEHGFVLSVEETQGLIEQAQRLKVTANVIIQTAWGLLLSRYGNQDTVVFGITNAGRPAELPDVEHMVGLFINSLPVVFSFNENNTVDAMLKQHHAQSVERSIHCHVALHEIHRLTDNKSQFDSLVVSENHNSAGINPNDDDQSFAVDNFDSDIKTNYSITVVSHFSERLKVKLEFKKSLMSDQQNAQICRHLKNVLLNLFQNPQHRIADIDLLSQQEQSHLINTLNQQSVTPSVDKELFLPQFSDAVRRHPLVVAVSCDGISLSYQQLHQLSDRLALYLQEMGTEKNDRVGIYLPRSIPMLVAVLGVMKAGASYVPMDLDLPTDRLLYMLNDAQIETVLLFSEHLEDLPLSGVDVLLMEESVSDSQWLSEFSGDHLMAEVSANDEVYVLYTSGSTGQPKGVSISHGGLAQYLSHAKHYMPSSVIASVVSSPLCFDATITALLTPLMVGGEVDLLAEGSLMISELNDRLFNHNKACLFKLTPSHLQALIYHDEKKLSNLSHRLVIGGESLSASLMSTWQNRLPQTIFYNEYGPTETVVGCCVYGITANTDLISQTEAAVPIGRAIDGTSLYVLDDQQRLLPLGASGELCIGGPSVSIGYLNQAKLTSEKFIKNPFGEGRLYRSGDLVKWGTDDQLHFIGRLDDQIKIRGYRVELSDIESCLSHHSSVDQALVMFKTDNSNISQLVAYLVLSSDQQNDVLEVLKNHAQSHLPHYMLPSKWLVLEAMPLTINGKVDKQALPNDDNTDQGDVFVSPKNKLQALLCEIWQDTLNRQKISINDNFFSIGGDSIFCIRIIAVLREKGYELTVQDFFKYPTIKQLCQKINVHQYDQTNDMLSQVTFDQDDALSEDEIETEI